MIVELSRLKRIYGDRILVRRLGRPEKTRGILVPQSYINKNKPKEQEIWYGIVEKFGIDSRYGDGYGIKEGDLLGINDLGISNAYFTGDDGEEHYWIMEEFVLFKDEGRIDAFRKDIDWDSVDCGLVPVGPYVVVRPDAIEEKRGAIHIPAGSQSENLEGRVLAVSAGEIRNGEMHPLRVNKDSKVLFGKYSGMRASLGKDTLQLIKEEDLIAELEPLEVMAVVNV